MLSNFCNRALRKFDGPNRMRLAARASTARPPLAGKLAALPRSRYGGRNAVTMLPGTGIGPELMRHVKEVFQHAGVPVDFETIQIDPTRENNDELRYAIMSIRRNGVAIKGNVETKSLDTGIVSRNVVIRNELDLFANVVAVRSYDNVPSRQKHVDLIIIRQNTEGEYAMLEHESVTGVVESMKVITRANSRRLARYAFEMAKDLGRKKVTSVHKANIMKLSDGLFLETCKETAAQYPDIAFNHMIIDNCCMQLVSDPGQFDVMVMPNLYGSIVSNVACGLVGGAGLISGCNYGDRYAVFEPGTRNTASAIAGRDIANPVAMLSASADMLEHLGHDVHCRMIRTAITKTLSEDMVHTADLKGTASTLDVVRNIIKHVKTYRRKCDEE